MLVLARRAGEKLKIGDDITVTILQIRGNQVSIGIQADKSIPVHREEIFKRIKDEEAEAEASSSEEKRYQVGAAS